METQGAVMSMETMETSKVRRSLSRSRLPLLAGGLLLALMGDRGVLSATSRGIDPLEILNLQVKPNIIVVFDSSGSMRESPRGGVSFPLLSGDWSGSKMFQAKQVLKTVVAANDQDVSFLFGRYTQQNSSFQNTAAGADRFSYTTQAWIVSTGPTVYGGPSPSMPTTQLTLQWEPVVINSLSNIFYYNEQGAILVPCAVTLPNGIYATTAEHNTLAAAIATAMNGCPGRTAPNTYGVAWNAGTRVFTITRSAGARTWQVILGGINGAANGVGFTASTALGNGPFATTAPVARGFQAFQDIQTGWNILNFREGALATCSVAITTGTYLSGAALAAEMQFQMNACPSRTNLYDVTYLANAGTFRFSRRSGAANFSMYWGTAANSIRAVLNAGTANTASGTSFTTSAAPRHLRRFTAASGAGNTFTETFDPDGSGPVGNTTVYTYRMIAGRFWNGQTLNVVSDGTFCGFGATTPVNPPGVSLQQVSACGAGSVGSAVFFEFAGGQFGGNNISCNGFSTQVPLSACDSATSQITAINPFLEREIPLDSNGNLRFSAGVGYAESTNGAYSATTSPPAGPAAGGGGLVADGATPIAASLTNIKTLFDGLWTTGQAVPAVTPISTHTNPKERTIVLFVTDGDDTCAGGSLDTNALRAANNAQRLYYPIVGGLNSNGTFTTGTDPASSVSTYMVGYGSGGSPTRLNYIAWGGSGLGAQMCPANNCATWAAAPTAGQRAACTTCQDAFIAPDAATLAAVIQSIINQGAQSGDFTAQASRVTPVYEYASEVPGGYTVANGVGSTSRYEGLFPVLFRTSFTLPGFQGHLYAITNAAGTALTRWDAGQRLTTLVQTGMAACNDGIAGQGLFTNIANGAPCTIPRRIYTTSRNGVFSTTVNNLTDSAWVQSNGNRTALWPPPSTVDPAAGNGILDAALGLPMTDDLVAWNALTTTYKACLGTPLPTACASASDATRVPAARKEARQMILAYTAGAQVVPNAATGNPARKATNPNQGQILYQTRSWLLGESTLADSAIISPPIETKPTFHEDEYTTYRDGPRTGAGNPTDGLLQGFGLRNPDVVGAADVSSTLRPVMSVVYAAANDMLHAFRAGPNNAPTTSSCTPSAAVECGGEELWGFVPYDQLAKLKDLMQPQTRQNHTFMVAAPSRFSDVFVPNPGTTASAPGTSGTTCANSACGATVSGAGVWRKLIIFGRGIAGKHLTALDVTAPGSYSTLTTQTSPPIVYWSRGNPDTDNGLPGGTANYDAADRTSYAKMGETWSVPAVARVNNLHSARKPCGSAPGLPCSGAGGVELVAFVGSGYSDIATEGTTFYTLDILTGDVVAAADVGSRSPAPAGGYANALVASPASYSPDQYTSSAPGHPIGAVASRVYIGDLHGRLWKFVTSALTTPILFADLGADQPIGAPVALIKLPADATGKPHIFAEAGNDSRAHGVNTWEAPTTGQFRYFGLRDDAADGDTTPSAVAQSCTPTVQLPCLYTGEFEAAAPMGGDFRGTAQPATSYTTSLNGVVFLVGTRFVPPPPKSPLSTPVPPYPCRSRFDSIVYALQADSGAAAFDLNLNGDDAYVVFDNSRIVAVTVDVDPVNPSGSSPRLDEGTSGGGCGGGNPPPPPPGPRPALGSDVVSDTSLTGSLVCK